MRTRSKTAVGGIWGRRGGKEPRPARTFSAILDRRQPPPPRHRHGDPTQDRAVYSCSCGYVFDAAVSTSVDCPHCGHTQAW
jgi:hypothetical protein